MEKTTSAVEFFRENALNLRTVVEQLSFTNDKSKSPT